jgi:hypothetical protein
MAKRKEKGDMELYMVLPVLEFSRLTKLSKTTAQQQAEAELQGNQRTFLRFVATAAAAATTRLTLGFAHSPEPLIALLWLSVMPSLALSAFESKEPASDASTLLFKHLCNVSLVPLERCWPGSLGSITLRFFTHTQNCRSDRWNSGEGANNLLSIVL